MFRRLSDRHFQDLQRFAQENHLVSTDGKAYLSVEVPDSHYVQHAMLRTIFASSQ